MEIKEYLQIIKKNIKLFSIVFVVVVASILAYFYFQPIYYKTSVTLNVTRVGMQATDQYRFDNFYRLQADEKVCETIVEWLKSPSIVFDIYSQSGENIDQLSLKKISKLIIAEKRSSQIVAVNFVSSDKELAQKISENIVRVISRNIEKLNKDQKEIGWFEIMGENPMTMKNSPEYKIILLASFFAGIFVAFLTVMIRHYLE